MSIKMKGLLKGLRYISQIFEEEEEEKEMQIGFPTDVKHVAHIGWDGPSVNSPSWMNEFKSPAPGSASPTPSQPNEELNSKDNVEEVNEAPQESSSAKKNAVKESPGRDRDMPGLPKSSRRQPSVDSIGSADSPMASPNHKSKSSRRRQKQKDVASPRGAESSNPQNPPNIPKKSRRKKSKDGDGSLKSSLRSKDKGSRHGSLHGSDDGSVKQYTGEANSSSSMGSLKE